MSNAHSRIRSRLQMWTLLLGSTMTVMAGAVIAPALPQLLEVFHDAPHAELVVKLLLAIHALFIALSAPFIGGFMDRWGRKPVLVASIILYGVAGSSGFYLNSLLGISLGRAFLGVSVAGIMSGFTTLIGDYYKGEKLHKIMGLQAAFAGFGGLVFLTVSGALAGFGWRLPFLVYLFAFCVLPGALFFLSDTPAQQGMNHEVNENITFESVRSPLLGICCIAFIGMMMFYLVPVQLPYLLHDMPGVSSMQVGLAIGIMNLVGALSSTQFKKVKERFSHQQIVALFALFMGGGYGLLGLAQSYGVVVIGLVISGIGFGLLMPNVNVWVVSLVPQSLRGQSVGWLTTFFLLGQCVSPLLAEPFVKGVGIQAVYGGACGILLCMALFFVWFARRN
ncbi:MFS transporter [Pseudodesulfovibrio piezophilus]|uniref:Major facilitator superfamily MFS_1 n=1 Tax=Pseudodesulfovibrio piezophilus (strain DSM 21447 / JCM 15486 / C1TLV30) TaxID=1322246 RepID=M1WU75_PSEP2|nr:MFS transporter [Pseudodesulfovibrio piezophilus]CCH50307.1 Major facilitator superfamily MFS_1 [Pseudodesulfovibrio piezophilus C1TLV30]